MQGYKKNIFHIVLLINLTKCARHINILWHSYTAFDRSKKEIISKQGICSYNFYIYIKIDNIP